MAHQMWALKIQSVASSDACLKLAIKIRNSKPNSAQEDDKGGKGKQSVKLKQQASLSPNPGPCASLSPRLNHLSWALYTWNPKTRLDVVPVIRGRNTQLHPDLTILGNFRGSPGKVGSHRTSVLGKSGSCILERLSYTGFLGKQTLKEHLTWSMFIKECLWDQCLCKGGRGRKQEGRRTR